MGKKKEILPGARFGRLTVTREATPVYSGKKRCRVFACLCDCGNEKVVIATSLYSGHTKSCGCYSRDCITERNTKHGFAKRKHTHRLYNIRRSMIYRCEQPKNKDYAQYGGRGIKVCAEWRNDFMAFYNWAMANGYADNLSIDRIDVNGNYEPSNCRWATDCQQSINRRKGQNNNSGYRGVYWCNTRDNRVYSISHNKKRMHVGFFDDVILAAHAYDSKARELFGENVFLNFPKGVAA